MSRRVGRLAAVMAVGLLALLAAAAGARLSIHLPTTASAIDTEITVPQAAAGTAPTRVKATSAKHGRTAPLLPVATIVALAALVLYGCSVAGATRTGGRLPRWGSWSRCSRGPPALRTV
jgi:ABC-type Na+ efflux pump permease subunit